MNRYVFLLVGILAASSLILVGCTGPLVYFPTATPMSWSQSEVGGKMSPPPGTPSAPLPESMKAVLFALAGRFRVPMDEVQVVRWEEVTWPDGCLGVPMDRMCTEVLVPGSLLVVSIEGKTYEYHLTPPDEEPLSIYLAEGPDPELDKPALEWETERPAGCEHLALAEDGRAAIGPCGAPQTPLEIFLDERMAQWLDLQARFTPFTALTEAGRITLAGGGEEEASAAWQRALASWAGLVQQELAAGRSGASWGAALAWNEPVEEPAGFCRFLAVETFGLAYASVARCEGGEAETLGSDWLTDDELKAFDGLLYTRGTLEKDGLTFFGLGSQDIQPTEADSLDDWARGVYERVAAAGTVVGPQGGAPAATLIADSPSSPTTMPTATPAPQVNSYVNEAGGYRLLYPMGFTVYAPDPQMVWIEGPVRGDGPEPMRASVSIAVSGAGAGKSLSQVVDEVIRDLSGVAIGREDASLGGEPAQVLVGLPGRARSRAIFSVHSGRIYRLIFQPVDDSYPQATSDVWELWESATRSFVYLP